MSLKLYYIESGRGFSPISQLFELQFKDVFKELMLNHCDNCDSGQFLL